MAAPIASAWRYRGGPAGKLGGLEIAVQEADDACSRRIDNPADGRFAEAPADFTRAIELDPQRPNAYRLRGIAYMNVGETAKAEVDYEKAGQLGFPGKQ